MPYLTLPLPPLRRHWLHPSLEKEAEEKEDHTTWKEWRPACSGPWISGSGGPGSGVKHFRTGPLSPGLDWTPTCEDVALLVAVGTGLQASSGCRRGVDATVGMGKQAAPSDSVDPLTSKCIEGLADLLPPCSLRATEKQEPVRKEYKAGTKGHRHPAGTRGGLSIILIPTALETRSSPRPKTNFYLQAAPYKISRHRLCFQVETLGS